MSANDDVEMSGIEVDHRLIFKECDNYDDVKTVDGGLHLFLFSLLCFIFSFLFFSIFYF